MLNSTHNSVPSDAFHNSSHVTKNWLDLKQWIKYNWDDLPTPRLLRGKRSSTPTHEPPLKDIIIIISCWWRYFSLPSKLLQPEVHSPVVQSTFSITLFFKTEAQKPSSSWFLRWALSAWDSTWLPQHSLVPYHSTQELAKLLECYSLVIGTHHRVTEAVKIGLSKMLYLLRQSQQLYSLLFLNCNAHAIKKI